MSKLFSIYLSEKNKNNDTILLFKSGIFFIALDKDALYLSNLFNFKLTNLNTSIKKCGFPYNSLDKYLQLFKKYNLDIKIIEITKNTSYSLNEYKESSSITKLIDLIKNVDVNNLSILEAYNFIKNLKEQVSNIL